MKLFKSALLYPIFCCALSACNAISPDINPVEAQANQQITAEYNIELGLAYLKQGQTARAKAQLLSALQQRPDWSTALDAMAYYHEQTGDVTSARNDYLKAITANPHAAGPQNNYGTFLCRQGDYRDSLTHFDNALQDKNYLNTAKVNENAGLCAMKIPDKARAMQYFEKALAENAHLRQSLLALASIQLDIGKTQQAEKTYKQFKLISEPTGESVYLSYRIAKKAGNAKRAKQMASLLNKQFKGTPAYQQYLASQQAMNKTKKKS